MNQPIRSPGPNFLEHLENANRCVDRDFLPTTLQIPTCPGEIPVRRYDHSAAASFGTAAMTLAASIPPSVATGRRNRPKTKPAALRHSSWEQTRRSLSRQASTPTSPTSDSARLALRRARPSSFLPACRMHIYSSPMSLLYLASDRYRVDRALFGAVHGTRASVSAATCSNGHHRPRRRYRLRFWMPSISIMRPRLLDGGADGQSSVAASVAGLASAMVSGERLPDRHHKRRCP